ncbi:Aspartate--tRNA ligase [Hondaea fermentalgiana]|uniref:Aspartate--tRNA ligase n=1 Tax=Hondaea fermentalgiana TaxID=2315210 RepID=A0A2R5GH13_9STRA|nr:Aspartate--tRNA ligase [Hondaea fermentalgiana]|eukprot:GBG30196.1 Aspartate--tRNA ligase [Hondaea fermentalgiana]
MRKTPRLLEQARRVACGEVDQALVGTRVEAQGWVQTTRKYGQLLFISLRDAKGSLQVVWNAAKADAAQEIPQDLHEETVVRISGTVLARDEVNVNERMKTGHVEVALESLEVLNRPVVPTAIPVERRLRPRPGTDRDNNNNNNNNKGAKKTSKTHSGLASQAARLRSRHLDLRGAEMQRNLRVRSALLQGARSALTEDPLDFVEVETPLLFKSTPEGAREFLVPTRNGEPGTCYALPQSPQQYKQLLMAGGIERYFQVARCFRDEDGRADRQPEFTQLDLEMSFATAGDIQGVIETVLGRAVTGARTQAERFARGIETWPTSTNDKTHRTAWEASYIPAPLRAFAEVQAPFARMSFEEAMLLYGSDKPDTRYGMKMKAVKGFSRLDTAMANSKHYSARAFRIPADVASAWTPSRKVWEELAASALSDVPRHARVGLVMVRTSSSGNLEALRLGPSPPTSIVPMFKALNDDEKAELVGALGAREPGDAFVMAVCEYEGAPHRVGRDALCEALGRARVAVGEATGEKALAARARPLDIFWVEDFPMFELGENDELRSTHHPFTMPRPEDIEVLRAFRCSDTDRSANSCGPSQAEVLEIRAQHYDLVCNGAELGGGSVRVHNADLQRHIFRHVLGISEERIEAYFGHLLAALASGCPPHAGIALGVDRLCAILLETPTISDVIAFPKSVAGHEPLTGAPTRVPDEALAEYHLFARK